MSVLLLARNVLVDAL